MSGERDRQSRTLLASVYSTSGLFMRARGAMQLARAAQLRDMPELVASYFDEAQRYRRLAKIAQRNQRELVDAAIRRAQLAVRAS